MYLSREAQVPGLANKNMSNDSVCLPVPENKNEEDQGLTGCLAGKSYAEERSAHAIVTISAFRREKSFREIIGDRGPWELSHLTPPGFPIIWSVGRERMRDDETLHASSERVSLPEKTRSSELVEKMICIVLPKSTCDQQELRSDSTLILPTCPYWK
jgi:hypothetical protein